ERDAPDLDFLTDHGVAVRVEHLGDRCAHDGHAAPRRVVPGGEHAAGRDSVGVDRHVGGGRAHDVHVDVLVALLHLEIGAQLGHDGGDVPGVVGGRGVVIQ